MYSNITFIFNEVIQCVRSIFGHLIHMKGISQTKSLELILNAFLTFISICS